MGLCRTNVMLDRELWKAAQDAGKDDDRSGSWILNRALEQYLNKKKPKKKTEVAVPEEDVILWLPCKSGQHPVTKDDVMQYIQTYPNIDLEVQLKSMYSWLDANPSKRKTANGMKRFINGWLQRESAKVPSVWGGDY